MHTYYTYVYLPPIPCTTSVLMARDYELKYSVLLDHQIADVSTADHGGEAACFVLMPVCRREFFFILFTCQRGGHFSAGFVCVGSGFGCTGTPVCSCKYFSNSSSVKVSPVNFSVRYKKHKKNTNLNEEMLC